MGKIAVVFIEDRFTQKLGREERFSRVRIGVADIRAVAVIVNGAAGRDDVG